jgi:hypothetical protein
MNNEDLIEILYQEGLQPRAYSGRAMFGRFCVGVEVEALGKHEYSRGWLHDSLGLGFIVYWPDHEWPDYLPIVLDGNEENEG